jgi:hypothetical protein
MSEENQKDRSPRAPRYALEDAIADMRKLHTQIGKSAVKSETAVSALGFNGLNGAALATLGTITQYGLINRTKGFIAVSPLAVRILHPMDEDQRIASIQEAALAPSVFREIYEKMNDCSEQVLTSYFVQNGFTPDGAKRTANVYASNKSFANLKSGIKLDLNVSETKSNEAHFDANGKMLSTSTIIRQPLGQHIAPKPANHASDNLILPTQSISRGSNLSLPLGNGDFVVIPKMSKEDFDLFMETLKLWEKKLILPQEAAVPSPTLPFVMLWKTKDSEKMVKIVNAYKNPAGDKYYQTEEGVAILASELFSKPS